MLTNRWLHTFVLLLMLAGTLFVRVQDYNWIKSLRFLAFDTYNRIDPRPQTDAVSIVDIDEESMGRPELGQWPWPRDVVARLIDNLAALGARAIVFDVVFAEDDRTSPQTLLKTIPAGSLHAEAEASLKALPDHDAVMAESIRRAGNVVTGFVWSGDAHATRRMPAVRPMSLSKDAGILKETVVPMAGATTNIPVLSQAAAGSGNFGVSTEVDGIIRNVPLLFRMKDPRGHPVLYPALSTEALRVAQDPRLITKIRKVPPVELGPFDPPFRMKVGQFEIPFDRHGDFYVWFAKARPGQYIPAWKVIEGGADPARIAGRIVFVGTSAEGLKDIRSTPLDLFIPGVEVHVNVVEQVLQKKYLLRPALIEGAEILAVAAVGLLIILLAPFLGAVYMAFFTGLLIAFIAWLSFHAFRQYGLLLDPVFPGLALLALNAASSLLTYVRTEAERRRVRDAFGLYISPDYMKELTSDPGKLTLGGEVRDLTVMFTDIRNFTTLAESMPPHELIHLMNDFLTPMSDQVMKNRGTIDKYMGDAMMAFWNAPLDDPDHARHACIAALNMRAALAPLNARLAAEGKAICVDAGIGINTGAASVGNMGSRQRFAYSALGDTVNLASRLEGQTKTYGVDILIGEETASKISDFALLEIDLIQVKGKTRPVRVFTILGDASLAVSTAFQVLETAHMAMIAAYRRADIPEAEKILDTCRSADSSGALRALYDLYAARLSALRLSPPGAGWDGVYIAATK